MAENLLKDFIEGCDMHIEAESANRNGIELAKIIKLHKQQSVSVLQLLFEPNFFDMPDDKSVTSIWLKYHMYQAKQSMGSMMLVFEICHLIHGMIKSYGMPKIRNYLFSKGIFNERQLRANLLEFFTALTFEQDGLKTSHDELYSPDNPLDVVVEFEGENRLVECRSIQEPEVLDLLLRVSQKMQSLLYKWTQNHGQSARLVHKIPFSYYLACRTPKDFRKNWHELVSKVKGYIQADIQPPMPNITDNPFDVFVEKHREGLFDNYMTAFESYKVVLIGKVGSSYLQTLPNIPIRHEGKISDLKDYMAKIKRAIKDKRDQHKNKNFKSKLYVLEIESFTGPSMGFELEKLDEKDLKNHIKAGETLWIIHKDSRGNQIPKRTIKMVTRDADKAWVVRLEQLIENKMKNSVMRILSEKIG